MKPCGGGRKKSTVWAHFTIVEDEDGKIIECKCTYCKKDISPQANRLQNHLDKCTDYEGQGGGGKGYSYGPTSTSTSGTRTRDTNPLGQMDTQLILLQKSLKRLQQTIENISIWVSSSYGVDIPEECFVDEKTDIDINSTSTSSIEVLENIKNEREEPGEGEVDDNYLNWNESKAGENINNLLDDEDEMLKIQNDSDSISNNNRKRTLKEMDNDNGINYSDDDPEFNSPDVDLELHLDNHDSDSDYGKKRRISQLTNKKPKNYTYTNARYKCKVPYCNKVFKSASYLNYIHMPTHKHEEQSQNLEKPHVTSGGRKKSTVWQYFTQIEEENADGKISKRSICLSCSKSIISQANRLQSHLDKCSRTSETVTDSLIPSPDNNSSPSERKIFSFRSDRGSSGRPKNDVWQYFNTTTEQVEGKLFKVSVCRNCGKNVSSQANRLQSHLDKCLRTNETATDSLIHSPDNSSLSPPERKIFRFRSGHGSSGRPKYDIWQYFSTTTEQVEGKYFKVSVCRNCGHNVSSQANRLQRHYNKCSSMSSTSLSHSASIKRKLGSGGRTKCNVWQFFTISKNQNENDGKIVGISSVCNFCKSRVSSQAPRLKNHIKKCPAYAYASKSDSTSITENENDTLRQQTRIAYKPTTANEDKRVTYLTCHVPKDRKGQYPTFVCPEVECKSAFFSQIRLKIHLKRIHNIPQEPRKHQKVSKYVKIVRPLFNSDGSPVFKCPQEACTSSFRTIVYLKKHLKGVHNIPPISRPYQKTININPESNDYTKPKTYMCPVCGKILMLGSKEVHDATHENKKQYRCDICPAAFNLRQHLTKHRNMHTREKIHICSQCGKEFLRLEALKVHTNTVHSDTRSFKCEFPNCDKSYKIKRQLVIHQRAVHIVEKPYECHLCSKKSFHTELGLKDHLLRSHKNELERE